VRSCRIGLVGDVLFHRRLGALIEAEARTPASAVSCLREHDVVVANLEMPLTRRGWAMPKRTTVRSDPAVIEDVVDLGIGAVSLANNHAADYGPDGLLDTLETCAAAGVLTCGAGRNRAAACLPTPLAAAGRTVVLLAFSCLLPNSSAAAEDRPGVAPVRVGTAFEIDPDDLAEQPGMAPMVRSWARRDDVDAACGLISAAKSDDPSAIVIAGLHWGVQFNCLAPYQGLLAEYQQPLGHALVDAGADVVWGHHPHVLHPIEVYRGRPILYSLGNFVFERSEPFMEAETVIATVGAGDDLTLDLIPVILDREGFPRAPGPEAGDAVLAKVARLSALFGTRIDMEAGRGCVRLLDGPP
jgi:poly-gamma-glutamate capsule biosynthesis protein CapA/YwtB (metallophosphatase superfamily)